MARPVGSPVTRHLIKLHIPETWVLKKGKVRYAFVEALSPRVFRATEGANDTNVYSRYKQILHRGIYNVTELYGLRAIDIDVPQESERSVSVQLEIIVGEGKDEVRKIT
jgi:hypothetical protein